MPTKEKINPLPLSFGLLRPYFWQESLELGGPEGKAKWLAVKDLLDETFRLAQKHSIKTALIYIPIRLQYDAHYMRDPEGINWYKQSGVNLHERWLTDTTTIQTTLAHWSKAQDIPFLDLTPSFRANIQEPHQFNFPIDGHWNKQGHELAARSIQKWISQNNIFDLR